MNWHNGVEPKFKVGDVVYHKASKERGVIVEIKTLYYYQIAGNQIYVGPFNYPPDNAEKVEIFKGKYDIELYPGQQFTCLETSITDSLPLDLRTYGEAF